MKPPLEFYLMARTYNSYGAHPMLSLISGLILADTQTFGPAVSELTLTFHFHTSGQPPSSLERLYAEFHAHRLKLPKIVFRRSREKVSIDVASNLIDGGDWLRCRDLSRPLLKGFFAETLTALDLLKPHFTAEDDFALDKFLSHCRERERSLPGTDEALRVLQQQLKVRKAAIRSAMSPWERLGIDWRDFHPNARSILDDPFYWEEGNDFSPHGNDTGADLLSDYRLWLRDHGSNNPLDFYRRLLARWGFSDDSTDPVVHSVLDEAAVALAFAELKIKGGCHPSVADFARKAVHRQRQKALQAADGPIKEDRLRSLELIEAKL
jgi:uncharacterized protein YfeS